MSTSDDPLPHFRSEDYLAINTARLAHLATLVDGLGLAPGASVLELGAGVGDRTEFWLSRGHAVTTSDARPANVAALRARFPHLDVRQLDLDTDAFPSESFDVVYAYGLLYHLADPARGIALIGSAARRFAFVETCVSFGDDAAINSVDEASDVASQAVSGRGCRPTRPWVFRALAGAFAHVYQHVAQPVHPQFPLDWRDEAAAQGGLHRSVFLAAREPVTAPGFYPQVLDRQLPYLAEPPAGAGDGLPAIMRRLGIGTVLDVGANAGQFAADLRRHGFSGQIHSFEPIPDVAAALEARAAPDPFWTVHATALGAAPGQHVLHVSANSYSSSLLDLEPRSTAAEPAIGYVDHVTVPVDTLDALWPALQAGRPSGAAMLKLDVQGAERDVLAGAEATLRDMAFVMAECSLVPIYRGEWLLEDLLSAMRRLGFHPVWIRPGWGHATTGQVYQCDVGFAPSPDL